MFRLISSHTSTTSRLASSSRPSKSAASRAREVQPCIQNQSTGSLPTPSHATVSPGVTNHRVMALYPKSLRGVEGTSPQLASRPCIKSRTHPRPAGATPWVSTNKETILPSPMSTLSTLNMPRGSLKGRIPSPPSLTGPTSRFRPRVR